MSNKISENISEQLEIAAEEALEKLTDGEIKPKRKRKAKEEPKEIKEPEQNDVIKCTGDSHIIAIVEWDIDDDTELPFKVEIPDSILVGDYNIDTVSDYLSNTTGFCHKGFWLEWPEKHKDLDEFCKWELEKAHLDPTFEEPDFDFRQFYSVGDKVYLVRHLQRVNTKKIHHLTIRTIYPRMMVGVEEKASCQCICYNERDNIFINERDAVMYFDSIDANVDEEETPKKKKKNKTEDDVTLPIEEDEE